MQYSCPVIDMAARSSQDQNATAGGDSKWCASWGSLISDGARALVNLMPNPFKGNQVLNELATDPFGGNPRERLVQLAQITANFLRLHSDAGDLKWDHTNVAIQVLQGVTNGTLDEHIPRMEPFALYAGSDSMLCMFTKTQSKTWQQNWAESKELWERHVSKAHFSVVASAMVKQIWAGLETIVRHNDSSRGNPKTFSEQLVFISAMNEKTYLKDQTFRDVKDQLESYPIGTVTIFGPQSSG